MLTDAALKALKSDPTKRKEISDGKRGLYFVIQRRPKDGKDEDAARSWAIRYRFGGKTWKHTLGRYPDIGLAVARDLAQDALENAAAGRNPATLKVQAVKAAEAIKVAEVAKTKADEDSTVQAAWNDYVTEYLPGLRIGTRDNYKRSFTHILPKWKKLQVASLTPDDVDEVFQDATARGDHAGNSCLTAVSSFLDFCADVKRRRKPYAIKTNPARGFEKHDYKARKHFLNDEEIPVFWRACDQIGGPFGPLFKLLLLTGCRRGELSLATWSEFNSKDRTLTIPAERAKNGRQHTVFLSDEAIAIIEALPRFKNCEWMFSTRGQHPSRNFSKAKEKLESKMADVRPWRIHDLRKTFATNCAALKIAIPVTERMLNHTHAAEGHSSELIELYQLHDYSKEARLAWQLWASRVRVLVESPASNVVPIRA